MVVIIGLMDLQSKQAPRSHEKTKGLAVTTCARSRRRAKKIDRLGMSAKTWNTGNPKIMFDKIDLVKTDIPYASETRCTASLARSYQILGIECVSSSAREEMGEGKSSDKDN